MLAELDSGKSLKIGKRQMRGIREGSPPNTCNQESDNSEPAIR